MAVSEKDLELLEEHLDGALDAPVVLELNRRLAVDAALSAELNRCKAHRAVRGAVWQGIDPDKAAADRMLWRVRGAMLDQNRKVPVKARWESWKIASIGSAAAACLLVGFLAGRVGSLGQPNQPQAAVGAAQLADNIPSGVPGKFNRVGAMPKVLVPISNEYGTVTWQQFETPEQAASFEADLHKAQGGAMPPAPSVAPKLASQEQEHF